MSEAIFNFHDTVLVATAFLSSLFVILLLAARNERALSDYFLAGFFVCQALIATHLLINYGTEIRDLALTQNPDLFYLFGIAFWLEGPLLFLFTRTLLFKTNTLRTADGLYFVPTLLYAAFILTAFYTLDQAEKIAHLQANASATPPASKVALEIIRESLRVLFGVLCILDIRRRQGQLKEQYSSIERYSLSWLTVLVLSFVAVRGWILVVSALSVIVPNLTDATFNALGLAGNYLTFALIAMMMFYTLQSSSFIADRSDSRTASPDNKYVPDEQVIEHIKQYMRAAKPYLQHLLNLDQLASQLGLNPRTLSTIIKHSFGTNFYEFVNTYRIKEAKNILEDPQQKNKTMIDIAGECGFNSKATYNTFFKKIVGCTPSEYRKKATNSKHSSTSSAKM